jgi:Fe-S cluster biogenesis protein NfuA
VQFIKEIIDSRIKPLVQEDGGDVDFVSFDEKTGLLLLELKGSCTGCPSSEVTLKGGIERMLKHYVAEVTEVRAINEED